VGGERAGTAAALDTALRASARPERAEHERAYLKSSLAHYGVPVPAIRALAKRASGDLDHDRLVMLVTSLWDEPADAPVHERRMLAAELLEARADLLTPADLELLERLLRQSRTWALVDTLAPSVVGPLSEGFPREVEPWLDRWARDDDFWLRRSALLAHLLPLRAGRGDWGRFTRYAEPLLSDTEFFVRKALGWVLRDTGRRRPQLVLDWVEPRMSLMSGVTVREAVKPFDPDTRDRLLAARRASGRGRTAGRPHLPAGQ
jgi:3-methyladenine DNA glycosylase AlkD